MLSLEEQSITPVWAWLRLGFWHILVYLFCLITGSYSYNRHLGFVVGQETHITIQLWRISDVIDRLIVLSVAVLFCLLVCKTNKWGLGISEELYNLRLKIMIGVYKTVCFLALCQFLKQEIFPDRNRKDPVAICLSKDWSYILHWSVCIFMIFIDYLIKFVEVMCLWFTAGIIPTQLLHKIFSPS